MVHADGISTHVVIVALRALSWVLDQHGEIYRTLVTAQQALTLSETGTDTQNIVGSLIMSGRAADRLGRADLATELYTRGLTLVATVSDEPWTRVATCVLSN